MMATFMRFRSFIVYPLLAAALFIAAGRVEARAWMELLWLFPLGLLAWTLIEYLLHRFIFHWRPRNPTLHRIVYGFHMIHHAAPREPALILARLRTSLPLSALIFGFVYALSGSPGAAAGLISGVWAGFLYYEWVHYRVHTSAAMRGLGAHRRRHFHHHFIDDGTCFGVTSPLWDLVFGTCRRIGKSGGGSDPARLSESGPS